jgi:hypothetical protein
MLRIIVLLGLVCLIQFGCNSYCHRVDCNENQRFHFTIQSSSTGEDMIFTGSGTINSSQVKMSYIENGIRKDAIIFFDNSFVTLYADYKQSTYYLDAFGSVDTLDFTFVKTDNQECCPGFYEIQSLNVNSQELIIDPFSTLILFR